MADIRIEFPARGKTYCHQKFGVYQYGEYPRSSVLAGQQSRQFLDTFDTLVEAKAAYPVAVETEGCGFREPDLSHLPDDEDY